MHSYIKRIAQVIDEDTYSRSGVRELVKQDIEEDLEGGLKFIYTKCIKCVEEYMAGSYWDSKDIRIMHIKQIPVRELVLNMFIAVVPAYRPMQIQALADSYAMSMEYDDIFDGVKTAAELFAACSHTGLLEMWVNPIEIQSKVSLNPETLDKIAKFKYLNPMKITPDRWSSHKNGGYITVKNHIILKPYNSHSERQCYDALNISQDIAWELDWDVINQGELSKKPLDTQEKRENFLLLKKYTEVACKEMGNSEFYFVWRYDSRGRQYSQGYYINLQSNEFRKAMLSFANKQLIT